MDARKKPSAAKRGNPSAKPAPEIKPMEVHHHPDLLHRPKPWKEYLLEFLMIFLAVTMGFYAESYREYLADRSKETEFMKGMVADLKADVQIMNLEISTWTSSSVNTDTVLTLLKSGNTPGNLIQLYKHVGDDFFRFNLLKYNNHTVEELKSSGNFRLISYPVITDSIMKYDNDVKYFQGQERGIESMLFDYKASEKKVLDYKYFDPQPYLKNFTIRLKDDSPKLLTTDKALLSQYYNSLFSYSLLASLHARLLQELRAEATGLSTMISKQYKLNE